MELTIAGPTPILFASLPADAIPTKAPVLPMVKTRPITAAVKFSCRTRYRMRMAKIALLKKFDVAVLPAIDLRQCLSALLLGLLSDRA